MITLPGLVDVHVHLRDPGQTQKEDFYTGTSAALAGGFTTVLDMPNNTTPITSLVRLEEKIKNAQEQIVCDIGFHFGTLGDNLDQFPLVKDKVTGIKLYLNPTTGNFLIDTSILDKVYQAWNNPQPILVHAEADVIGQVIEAVRKYRRHTHVCHVSSQQELSFVIKAKQEGLPISCGVCPHHLFLTEDDVKRLGPLAMMKPALKTKKDMNFLWENLKYVDVIESDHAPHTLEEKNSEKPPFGVPGLDTTLPLMLTAVHENRLTLDRLIELCHTTPVKLFNLKTDSQTKVEIDFEKEYTIERKNLKTKCGWSPYEGMKVRGAVKTVFLRGEKVFEDGRVIAKKGSGTVVHF